MRGLLNRATSLTNSLLQSIQVALSLYVKKMPQVFLFFSMIVAMQVQAQATKPIADAGSPQSAVEGNRITLDGSMSSDSNNAMLTYSWTILTPETGIVLSSFTAAKPSFLAPEVDTSTEYLFSLVVSNGTTQSDADSVTATVTDTLPVANAGVDQMVNEGDEVTLDGSLSFDPDDPDRAPLNYAWEIVSPKDTSIVLSDAAAENPTFTTLESTTPATFIFRLVVKDNMMNRSTPDDVFIKVDGDDDAPIARIAMVGTVVQQTTVTLDGSGSMDLEGQSLTFSWEAIAPVIPGIALSSATVAAPTFVAPMTSTAITQVFRLTVSDGTRSNAASVTVAIVPNQYPEANAGDPQTVQEDTVVTLSGTSTDAENDPVTYHWAAPVGITLLPSETVANPTFTAPDLIGSTTLVFSLVVNDGNASRPATVAITVNGDDDSPTAVAGPAQSVAEGTTVRLNGSAQDPDSTTFTYSWASLDGIMLSDPAIAAPEFTAPNVSGPTPFRFSLTVSDGNTESTPAPVVITVTGSNAIPVASVGVSSQTVAEGTLVTLSGSGTDPDSNTLFYSWTQISPDAPQAVLPATATAVFTAPEVITNTVFVFSLIVNDGSQNSAAVTTTVTITGDNDGPTANAGNDQIVSGGQSVTLTALGSTDPENKSLIYIWTPPTTITLSSNADPTPVFTAPVVTSDRVLTFSLIVSDSDNPASFADTINVTVRAIGPQEINQVVLPKVVPMLSRQIATSVAKRVSSAATTTGNKIALNGYTSFADIVKHQAENLQKRRNIKTLLNNSEFSFSLDKDSSDNPNTRCLSCAITFWGSGSHHSISAKESTKEGGLDINGNFYISQLGADSGFSDQLLIGATAMWAKGNFDYTRGLNKGTYELNIGSLYPYFGLYFFDKKLNVWGTLGYGAGDLKITTPNEQFISQVKNRSVAVGITGQVFNFGYNSLNIKGEITNSKASVSGGAHVPMLEVDVNQLKVLVEVARVQNSPQTKKQTSIATGLRYEDAISKDVAVEIAGDVHIFFATEEGIPEFTLQANVYALIGKDSTEWGIQGIFKISDKAGHGIYYNMAPGYGNGSTELNHIWSTEISDQNNSQQPQQQVKFEAQLGYGMKKANGLLTPYTAINLVGNASRYTLGLRWQPTTNVHVSLVGKHLNNQGRENDQALLFKIKLRL